MTGNKNGQSNLLYLPLDKMIQSGSGGSSPAKGVGPMASGNTDITPHITEPQPTRTRESR